MSVSFTQKHLFRFMDSVSFCLKVPDVQHENPASVSILVCLAHYIFILTFWHFYMVNYRLNYWFFISELGLFASLFTTKFILLFFIWLFYSLKFKVCEILSQILILYFYSLSQLCIWLFMRKFWISISINLGIRFLFYNIIYNL